MQVKNNSIQVAIQQTRARQTPKTDFGSVLKAGVNETDMTALSAVEVFQGILVGLEDFERDLKRRSGAPWLAMEVAAVTKQLRTTVARINTSRRAEARANVVENPRTLQSGSPVTVPRVK